MPAIEVLNQSEPALSPILQLVRVLVIFLGLAAQIPPNKSVLPPGLPPQVSKEQCCPNEAFCLIMEMQICSDFEDRSMLRLIKTASATALMFAAQHLVSCQCFELTMRKIKTVSPQASASYISLLFFSWLDPLVWNGWKRPLRQQDLPAVSPEVLLVKKIKSTVIEGGSGEKRASVPVTSDQAAGNSRIDLSLENSYRLLWIGLLSGLH